MIVKSLVSGVVIALSFMLTDVALAKNMALSDTQVKEKVIEESVASYPGTCACPFNQARNGSSCGRRSAWSRQGGYSPICYKDEVTKEMIKEWRENH